MCYGLHTFQNCKKGMATPRIISLLSSYFAERLCIRLYSECAKLSLDIKKEKKKKFYFCAPKVFKHKLEEFHWYQVVIKEKHTIFISSTILNTYIQTTIEHHKIDGINSKVENRCIYLLLLWVKERTNNMTNLQWKIMTTCSIDAV